MPVCLDFRRIRSRLQDMVSFRREKKRTLKIVRTDKHFDIFGLLCHLTG